MRELRKKEDIENYDEKAKFLMEHGWEISWDDDNWVRSDSPYKEANNGTPTDVVYNSILREIEREKTIEEYLQKQKEGNLKPLYGRVKVTDIPTFKKKDEI